MSAIGVMSEHGDQGGPPRLAVLPGGFAGRADEELLRAFLAGDEAAFSELWRRHAAVVLAVVRRHARRADDAADLVQRAFLRTLEAARRRARPAGLRRPFLFRPFLVRVALNLVRNHARDEARWPRSPLEAIDLQVSHPPAAEEAAVLAERRRLVHAAMEQLPRRQREVLSLRLDGGLPSAEVAGALGISENAAKVHFHHAARRLRAALAGREGEP